MISMPIYRLLTPFPSNITFTASRDEFAVSITVRLPSPHWLGLERVEDGVLVMPIMMYPHHIPRWMEDNGYQHICFTYETLAAIFGSFVIEGDADGIQNIRSMVKANHNYYRGSVAAYQAKNSKASGSPSKREPTNFKQEAAHIRGATASQRKGRMK